MVSQKGIRQRQPGEEGGVCAYQALEESMCYIPFSDKDLAAYCGGWVRRCSCLQLSISSQSLGMRICDFDLFLPR